MNQNYYNQMPYNMYQQTPYNSNSINKSDDRFVGALAFPFLLGGVTGAALAPAFWRPSPYGRPYPMPYPPMPYPPYYGSYYR
ncbi:MAG: hypothetical protein RR404_01430 [Bacilli bacterium]